MRSSKALFLCFFFFKQKAAYEMRISDWSSDVCSSDLLLEIGQAADVPQALDRARIAAARAHFHIAGRSEERRVGKECVSTCSSRWSPSHYKKINNMNPTTHSSAC